MAYTVIIGKGRTPGQRPETIMYQANDKTFVSFFDAIKYAKSANTDVIEIETGLRRWTPAPAVSAKKMRRYQEQLAAYQAKQSKMA